MINDTRVAVSPWADTRLPPVIIEIPDPAGAGWLGQRKATFLNAGLTVSQIGPLLVPKLIPATRFLAFASLFALLAAGAAVATALGFDLTIAAILFLLSAVLSFGTYARDARTFRESGKPWDRARDLTFNLHGDKLINLGAIPTTHARRDLSMYVASLATSRQAILGAQTGTVTGEAELLRALAAVGEYARHLQDAPDGKSNPGYPDVADNQQEARAAAAEAMAEFIRLDPLGTTLLDAMPFTDEGTRK